PRASRASGALVGIGVRLEAARINPVQIVPVDRLKLGAAAGAATADVGRLLEDVVGDMDQAAGAPDGEQIERLRTLDGAAEVAADDEVRAGVERHANLLRRVAGFVEMPGLVAAIA